MTVHDYNKLPHTKPWHGLPHLDRTPLEPPKEYYYDTYPIIPVQIRMSCTNTFYIKYTLWDRFTAFIYRVYRRFRHERIDF